MGRVGKLEEGPWGTSSALRHSLRETGRTFSMGNRELPTQVPLSFRETSCFKVILPRVGLSQAHWRLWHKEQKQGNGSWADRQLHRNSEFSAP